MNEIRNRTYEGAEPMPPFGGNDAHLGVSSPTGRGFRAPAPFGADVFGRVHSTVLDVLVCMAPRDFGVAKDKNKLRPSGGKVQAGSVRKAAARAGDMAGGYVVVSPRSQILLWGGHFRRAISTLQCLAGDVGRARGQRQSVP